MKAGFAILVALAVDPPAMVICGAGDTYPFPGETAPGAGLRWYSNSRSHENQVERKRKAGNRSQAMWTKPPWTFVEIGNGKGRTNHPETPERGCHA